MANNTETISKCILMLSGTYRIELDDFATEAYHIALEDLSSEQINAATKAVLVSPNFEFMPTPGKLRELAVTGGIDYATRAERAWAEFDRAVSHHGPDHSVTFADGLINATVRTLGDWIFCCGRTGDDYAVWLRRSFIETYSRLCVNGASESLRQPLMGNLWRENQIFPDELLGKFKANTGEIEVVATAQPVLLAPSEAPKRIEQLRPASLPKLELKKAN